ncbi:Glutathione S-transferase C-terminal-like, partial [Trinorchestia longiramus]
VMSWMVTAETDLLPLLAAGKLAPRPQPGAEAAAQRSLERLNRYLRDHTFLVGERVSLADLSVFCCLVGLYRDTQRSAGLRSLTCLTRWYNTVLHQPPVQTALADFKLAP